MQVIFNQIGPLPWVRPELSKLNVIQFVVARLPFLFHLVYCLSKYSLVRFGLCGTSSGRVTRLSNRFLCKVLRVSKSSDPIRFAFVAIHEPCCFLYLYACLVQCGLVSTRSLLFSFPSSFNCALTMLTQASREDLL